LLPDHPYCRALIVWLVVACSGARVAAERSLPDLITIGGARRPAELVSINAEGAFQFRDDRGKPLSVIATELVRWSTPVAPRSDDEIILTDGSRLALAPAWGKDLAVSFDGEKFVARTTQFGRVQCDRSGVRAAAWHLPGDEARRVQIWDELLAASGDDRGGADALILDNEDHLTGTLLRIGKRESQSNDEAIVVTFESSLGVVELPVERIRGLCLSVASEQPKKAVGKAPLQVGLSDGSRLAADAIRNDGDDLLIVSRVLDEVRLRRREDLTSLQSFHKYVTYLSELDPISHHHEPYLDLAWTYRRDRNVLGAPLQVDGRSYPAGLGMHSAARVTYQLDGSYDRFAATVAIDDAANGGGSVVFHVFVRSGEDWTEAYSSEIVRGGDPAADVAVDLAGASQLALVVDYADRGDERDYANWLDARLERTQ
jgi:hypothetical protein